MPITGLDLLVEKADLAKAEIAERAFPGTPPEGHCLLAIDRFALTANNITYGVAAEMLGYWDFFPADDRAHGRIPVWGFADVLASSHPEVAVGRRVYGYLPMSTHVMVAPGKVSGSGFLDAAPHRAERASIYNRYVFCDADPMWRSEDEAQIALFRPLFTTSFLLEDMHRAAGHFGAERLLVTSASSKTAIGLAHLAREQAPQGVSVTGLTSTSNRAFVEGLGCYDEVLAYDELDRLGTAPACLVDLAGNAGLRRDIHARMGDDLKNSCAVGMTHWQESGDLGGALPGPRPVFFFAPSYAEKRLADWGADGFQARLAAAWDSFIAASRDWFEIRHTTGADAVRRAYLEMQSGRISPREGLILSMQGDG